MDSVACGQVVLCGDKEVQRGPPPPFTTSTMQQEANRRLGWPTSRTMSIAQDLFEGSNIDNGMPSICIQIKIEASI